MKHKMLSKGQTLLEAIVAIGVLAIILTAAATAVVNSINNANFANNQNLANKYAQELMEEIRNLEARSYPDFKALLPNPGSSKSWCYPQLTAILRIGPNCDCGAGQCIQASTGTLVRQATFINNEDIPAGEDKPCQIVQVSDGSTVHGTLVTVDVKWSSGKCTSADPYCHKTTLQTCIMPPI